MRALRPLSPVHLKGRKRSGDLHISWTRRGRIDADSWLAEEIPLGERRELYRVEIAPEGGAARRTIECTRPEWTYTAAMMQADFGGMPAAIDVTVRQVSVAAGPGTPLRGTVRTGA